MMHFNQFIKSTGKKLVFLLIFTSLLSYQLLAQVLKDRYTDKGIGYLEYLPDDYNSSSKTYPVIIFLHGVGERGNDLSKLRNSGLPRMIEKRGNMCFTSNSKNECFIVITPQLPSSYGNWDSKVVDNTIEYVKKKYRADPNRINLTGFSLGAGGTWAYSYSDENKPNKLASIAPIAGWASTKQVCHIADSHLSVWAFHGAKDPTISVNKTKDAISALNNCSPSPNPKPKMTIYPDLGHTPTLALTMDHSEQNPNLFEWFLAQRKGVITSEPAPSPDNKAPIARAGNDITTANRSITLDGRSSSDSDGKITKYEWTKISGSINFGGVRVGAVQTLSDLRAGDYTFELTVIDDDGAKSSDRIFVKVIDTDDGGEDPVSGNGEPLVAKAGADATIYVRNFTLDGRGSSSRDGKIIKYIWEKLSGPIAFGGLHEVAVYQVTDLRVADYVFQLTVIDDKGNTATDKISVTVLNTDNTPDTPNNTAPVAKAGNDITIYTPDRSITLDGRGSSDSDGKIVKYVWEKISGPLDFGGLHEGAVKQITDLRAADYEFELTVTDDDGAKSSDRIKVRVINSSSNRTLTASELNKGNAEATKDELTLGESLNRESSDIAVYPNPFQNELTLDLGNETEGMVTITILDLSGRIAQQISKELSVGEKSVSLDLSALSLKSGVWFVKVEKEDGTTKTLRLIKQ